MSLLLQLARSLIHCTALIPRVATRYRQVSFRYRPRVDPNEHFRLEKQEKSKGTNKTNTEAVAHQQEAKKEGEAQKTEGEKESKPLSMWEHHARMYRKGPEIPPRMDDLYYTATDRNKRVYTQTWIDYPDVKITKKIKYKMEDLDDLSERIVVKPPANEGNTHTSTSRAIAASDKSRKSQIHN